jgi:hypothetical protein
MCGVAHACPAQRQGVRKDALMMLQADTANSNSSNGGGGGSEAVYAAAGWLATSVPVNGSLRTQTRTYRTIFTPFATAPANNPAS